MGADRRIAGSFAYLASLTAISPHHRSVAMQAFLGCTTIRDAESTRAIENVL